MVMKKSFFVCVAALLFVNWTDRGIAQQLITSEVSRRPKVSSDLWEKIQNNGVVAVTVGLNVPWQPEGKLNKESILTQRQAIGSAQQQLLSELTGTSYKLRFQQKTVPYLSLEVGHDALAILERSALVNRVTEIRRGRPS
jgi:hypothetical protein